MARINLAKLDKATINDLIINRYTEHLRYRVGQQPTTVASVARGCQKLLEIIPDNSFLPLDDTKALAIIQHMEDQVRQLNMKPGSFVKRVKVARGLYEWLRDTPGFTSRVSKEAIPLLRISQNLRNSLSTAHKFRAIPTLKEMKAMFSALPRSTPEDLRNRAGFAVAVASGMRGGAIASMQINHYDPRTRTFSQRPLEGQKAKKGKNITVPFIDVFDGLDTAIEEWIQHLKQVQKFKATDPLFPPIISGNIQTLDKVNNPTFGRGRKLNEKWLERVFESASKAIGTDTHFVPHATRSFVIRQLSKNTRYSGQFAATATIMGHEYIEMTLGYGKYSPAQAVEIARTIKVGDRARVLPKASEVSSLNPAEQQKLLIELLEDREFSQAIFGE